jgi:two-component system sensor kinase FixL
VKRQVDIIKDLSLLYELSLAVGRSIELTENAEGFLETLVARKNLSYAAIWLHDRFLGGARQHNLLRVVAARPAFRNGHAERSSDHYLWQRLEQEPIFSLAAGDAHFEALIHEKKVQKGAYAVFKLGNLGFLKIYDQKRKEVFSAIELNQLRQVLAKLTVSLRGSVSHLRFQEEFREKSRYANKLDENEKKIRSIIDSALDGVITINQAGLITEWNSQAAEMFGWKREEAMGQRLSEVIIPHAMREAHESGMAHFLATGEGPVLNQRIEVPGLHRSGHEFPVELSIVPIKSPSGEHLFSAFLRDITQQKEAESKREQLLQRLEKANNELRNFAYIVSHDLKAPLRAIGSLAHWIQEDYAAVFDEAGQEQMSLLIGRVERMNELINGILDYSRVGRQNTKKEWVESKEVVAKTLQLLAPPENIHIRVVGDWPRLRINPIQAQQVFQNLISNAIKYLDKPQGDLEIGGQLRERDSLFWVKDNGPGIEEKYYERIFRIFQTLKPRDEVEATGVGLSIVQKIITLNEGKIWLESEVGKGSTFYFTFPRPL